MTNDRIVKRKRTLHKKPTPTEYGIRLEKASQKAVTPEEVKKNSFKSFFIRKWWFIACVFFLPIIATIIHNGTSSNSGAFDSSAGSVDTTHIQEDGIEGSDSGEDPEGLSQEQDTSDEEIKAKKWVKIFDDYTARTAGKESSIWLLELDELGELMEGKEGVLFAEDDIHADSGSEDFFYAVNNDDRKKIVFMIKDGDSVWPVEVSDDIYNRIITVWFFRSESENAPDIIVSLVKELFGLDINEDIPAQMGISEDMLYDRTPIDESYSYSYYRNLDYSDPDYPSYNSCSVTTWEYETDQIALDMYRYGVGENVDLKLSWKTDNGNLPYYLQIMFDPDLVYSNRMRDK